MQVKSILYLVLQYLEGPFLRMKRDSLQQQLALIQQDLRLNSDKCKQAAAGACYEEYLQGYHERMRIRYDKASMHVM
jgi:hypothetical protein